MTVGRRLEEPSGKRGLRGEEERGLASHLRVCDSGATGPFLSAGCPSNLGGPTLGHVKKQPYLSEQVPEVQSSGGKE